MPSKDARPEAKNSLCNNDFSPAGPLELSGPGYWRR